ncbi:indole-3-glycerol phosphate synthase TrpC [Desulfotomaculum sp. 1211_IL3151]|uniref:indole-3-glycerol phosphate synthase TrpC n=1 Tax=Desulfotomaculum sp. 1211_IL3151 TaxID=3084055 RepID=UPI002FD9CD49
MILDQIVQQKQQQVALQRVQKPLPILLKELEQVKPVRDFTAAVHGKAEMSVIAEIKQASPAKGMIRKNFDPPEIAAAYTRGGAKAISVLTETKFFGGSEELIGLVKGVTPCPLLRKDFIIDPYQVYQSRLLGADAILLIVAVLGKQVKDFCRLATELGLACLVEVHDLAELELALGAGAKIIGINNRNLHDFSVDLRTTEQLATQIPEPIVKVSASGIKTAADIVYLKALGVNAVLIGEALMRAGDQAAALAKLREAGVNG